jgi:hypothetical protein
MFTQQAVVDSYFSLEPTAVKKFHAIDSMVIRLFEKENFSDMRAEITNGVDKWLILEARSTLELMGSLFIKANLIFIIIGVRNLIRPLPLKFTVLIFPLTAGADAAIHGREALIMPLASLLLAFLKDLHMILRAVLMMVLVMFFVMMILILMLLIGSVHN